MTSDILGRLWGALGTHLWQTTLVLAALFIVARTLRRAPAGLLNSLFWIGLVKLLIPLPLLKGIAGSAVDAAVRTAASAGPAAGAAIPIVEGTAAVMDPAGAILGESPHLAGGWPVALTALWVSGFIALTVVWILSARPWRRETTPLTMTPDIRDRLATVLRGTDVPASVVVVTDSNVIPFVTGLLRPRIVVPRRLLEEAGDAAIRSILIHENAHRRRREPLRLLLSRATAVVFFFYPLVWPLLKRIRETGEMTCDDAVLASGVRPRAYASALAVVFDMGLTTAPSSAALDRRSPSLMRRRLMRLNGTRRCKMQLKHRAALSLVLVCVLMASALSLSSLAGDPSTDAKAPDPPAKPDTPPVEAPAPEPAPEPSEFFISKMIPPEYPDAARAKGLESIVFLQLTLADDLNVASAELKTIIVGHPPLEIVKVGKDGKVVDPVEEEGMEAFHEVFVKAATEAALQWEIEVNPEGARTDKTTLVVPIQFRLDGEKEKKVEKTEEKL